MRQKDEIRGGAGHHRGERGHEAVGGVGREIRVVDGEDRLDLRRRQLGSHRRQTRAGDGDAHRLADLLGGHQGLPTRVVQDSVPLFGYD